MAASEPVLIVEDEPDIAALMDFHLRRAGHQTIVTHSGREALEVMGDSRPSLVVLDIMLPDLDGLAVCRHIKGNDATRRVPIVFVTAKGEEEDIVRGLELGADDYVTKPFSPKILLARVAAVLRRHEPEVLNVAALADGRLEIDAERHEVRIDGAAISLTVTQYRILEYLARRPGFVRTRSQIIAAVRGEGTVLTSRTIDVHVAALRQRLGSLASIIATVRGVGYRLLEDAEVPALAE